MLRALTVLIAGVAAGTSLASGVSLSGVDSVAFASFVEVQRAQFAGRLAVTWVLDLVAVMLAVYCTIRLHSRPTAQRAAGFAVVGLTLALVIGLFPIQSGAAAIAEWAVSGAPSNARDGVSSLETMHLLRALLEGLAGVAIAVSLSLDRPVRKRYGPLVTDEGIDLENRPSLFVPGE